MTKLHYLYFFRGSSLMYQPMTGEMIYSSLIFSCLAPRKPAAKFNLKFSDPIFNVNGVNTKPEGISPGSIEFFISLSSESLYGNKAHIHPSKPGLFKLL